MASKLGKKLDEVQRSMDTAGDGDDQEARRAELSKLREEHADGATPADLSRLTALEGRVAEGQDAQLAEERAADGGEGDATPAAPIAVAPSVPPASGAPRGIAEGVQPATGHHQDPEPGPEGQAAPDAAEGDEGQQAADGDAPAAVMADDATTPAAPAREDDGRRERKLFGGLGKPQGDPDDQSRR